MIWLWCVGLEGRCGVWVCRCHLLYSWLNDDSRWMLAVVPGQLTNAIMTGRPRVSWEESVGGAVETLCSLFDNVYMLRSLGVLPQDGWLLRTIDKGHAGSKLWLVSLVLALRRALRQLVSVWRLKSQCQRELRRRARALVADSAVTEKLVRKVKECNGRLRDALLDLAQNTLYIVVVLYDICGWRRLRRLKVWCEYGSNVLVLLRICNAALQ